MNRKELILACLSTSKGAKYQPVQVQKMFFIIDKEAAHLVGGPHFDFQPYHYGPFDKDVYTTFEELGSEGYIEIDEPIKVGSKRFSLTPIGQEKGQEIFSTLSPNIQDFFRRLDEFVRKLSFQKLVMVIYERYPEMRARSVFKE